MVEKKLIELRHGQTVLFDLVDLPSSAVVFAIYREGESFDLTQEIMEGLTTEGRYSFRYELSDFQSLEIDLGVP